MPPTKRQVNKALKSKSKPMPGGINRKTREKIKSKRLSLKKKPEKIDKEKARQKLILNIDKRLEKDEVIYRMILDFLPKNKDPIKVYQELGLTYNEALTMEAYRLINKMSKNGVNIFNKIVINSVISLALKNLKNYKKPKNVLSVFKSKNR